MSSGWNKKIIGQYNDNSALDGYLALIQEGETVSTVYRIMKQNGLIKKVKRHPYVIARETQLLKRAGT